MLDGLNILTISGWTQPHDALHVLVPHAEALDYAKATSLQEVAALPKSQTYDLIIGWSLGGVLARELLTHSALNSKALVLLSTPYQFVADEQMPHAMGPTTFEQFYGNYSADAKRTSGRFHALVASGDSKQKDVMSALKHHPDVLESEVWLPWLDYLRSYSSADRKYDLPATLMLHGEKDAIISHAQAPVLADMLNAKLISLPEAGHAPHLHDADVVRAYITTFYKELAHG